MRKDRVLSDSKGLQRLHNSYPNAAQKVIELTGLLPNEAKESWIHPLKEQGSSSPANAFVFFFFFKKQIPGIYLIATLLKQIIFLI